MTWQRERRPVISRRTLPRGFPPPSAALTNARAGAPLCPLRRNPPPRLPHTARFCARECQKHLTATAACPIIYKQSPVRGWRNWQTRKIQVLVSSTLMWVQVPSRAPSSPQGELRNSSPSIGGLFACMPAAPLRVAKMQDVHSLLVFRFAAKLSPVHSFLLRGINFAEVLFLWRIRSRRDLNGATEPEPRNTPFLSRRKRRIHTFMNASVRTDRIHIRTTRKKNGAYYRKNTRRSALIFRSKPGSCCRFSCRG